MRRQIPLAHAGFARRCQNRADLVQGKRPGDHPQADVIADPAARWQPRNRSGHLKPPFPDRSLHSQRQFFLK